MSHLYTCPSYRSWHRTTRTGNVADEIICFRVVWLKPNQYYSTGERGCGAKGIAGCYSKYDRSSENCHVSEDGRKICPIQLGTHIHTHTHSDANFYTKFAFASNHFHQTRNQNAKACTHSILCKYIRIHNRNHYNLTLFQQPATGSSRRRRRRRRRPTVKTITAERRRVRRLTSRVNKNIQTSAARRQHSINKKKTHAEEMSEKAGSQKWRVRGRDENYIHSGSARLRLVL